MAIKMASKVSTCCIIVVLIDALVAAGAMRSKYSSNGGIQSSGEALVMISGDALQIAPAHRHGHRNGPRWRCICSPPPPISVAVIIVKDHVMVH